MFKFIEYIIFGLIFLILGSLTCKADLFELQSVDIDGINYFSGGVDPLLSENGISNRAPGQTLSLGINTIVSSYLYWDSIVHAGTDTVINSNGSTGGGQFRDVGLQFRLGINLTDNIQFGYFHHSQHILDSTYAYGPFPRLDGLELHIQLYKNPHKPEAMF